MTLERYLNLAHHVFALAHGGGRSLSGTLLCRGPPWPWRESNPCEYSEVDSPLGHILLVDMVAALKGVRSLLLTLFSLVSG